VQAIGRQPQRAPDGAPLHYERHRPEQTTLYRLVQQHAARFIAHTEASTGAELPRFIKDEFDAFLDCGILRLRCGECGHDKLLAVSCKRRGFCPSCGARRMPPTAAHLVDQVIPHVPVRQWVLSMPIPLRVLLAAQPELVTPVLQVVQRMVTRYLLDGAGLKADEGQGGAVTLIQRFGSAANLHVHLHCLVLDGVYRCGADGSPAFIEADAPTDDELHALLQTVIARLMKMLTRRGVLVEEMGQSYLAEPDADGEEARTLRPLQAAAVTYRIAFGPRAGQKVLTLRGAMPAGAVGRADPAQRRGPGGTQAQDTVARRDDASGDEPAGVHAAAGRPGATAMAAPHQISQRPGAERQTACSGGAAGTTRARRAGQRRRGGCRVRGR
jgi:hypothetical protein